MSLQKHLSIGILILNLMFFSMFIGISVFNKFATDDFYYTLKVNSDGVIGASGYFYKNVGGRWLTTLLVCIVTKLVYKAPWILAVYNTMLLLLLVLGITGLIKKVFETLKYSEALNLAMLLIQFSFFLCPSKGQVWFWLNGITIYLLPFIALIWGIYFLILQTHKTIFKILLIPCFIIAGGGAESIAITAFFVLAYYIYAQYQSIGLNGLLKHKTLFIVTASFIIAVFINLLSAGNYRRMEVLEDRTLSSGTYLFFNTYRHLTISLLVRLPIIMSYGFIFFIIGSTVFDKIKAPSIKHMLILAIWSACLIFPASYLLMDIAPSRVLTPLFIVLAALFAWAFCFLGNKIKPIRIEHTKTAFVSVIGIMIIVLFINTYKQTCIAKAYSDSIDVKGKLDETYRVKRIESFPANMPYAGYLYSGNLSFDDYYYPTKENLKRTLELY